jgi:hypothetical protein
MLLNQQQRFSPLVWCDKGVMPACTSRMKGAKVMMVFELGLVAASETHTLVVGVDILLWRLTGM